MPPSVDVDLKPPVRPRRRFVRFTALGVTVGVAAAAMVTVGGGSADAETLTSHAAGRFLTGAAAGQSFDAIAALNGEKAAYPDNPGPNQNNLSGSVLGQALDSPLGNVSAPFPGGVTFGAVGQFAEAKKDGSASASSGLIGSDGAINVGGSGNDNAATIDLANLPGAATLTNLLGDLTLTVGAVSARAEQAADGKDLDDPSANCTGGTYSRVSDEGQAGSYQFANLTLSATSPLLATLGSTLTTNLGTLLTALSGAASALPGGVVTITGLPTAAQLTQDLTVSLAGGGVTASLLDGSLTIDLAKILKSAGLDIDNLCPNTSLTSYLASALAGLPSAIDTLVTGLASTLTSALGKVTITVAGIALNATALTDLTQPVITALTTNLSTITTALDAALQPAVDAITDNLLDLTANVQQQADGAFTEAALSLALVPNGGSVPTVPGLPPFPAPAAPSFPTTLPGLPTIPVAVPSVVVPPVVVPPVVVPPVGNLPARASTGTAAYRSANAQSVSSVRLIAARLAAPVAAAPTADGTPALQLNLALAAVSNGALTATTTPTPTPSSGVSAESTDLPTGIPAGAAGHQGGGSPALPIVLVLIGLVLAGGGVTAYRGRARYTH